VPEFQGVAEKGEEKKESCYRNLIVSRKRVTEKGKLCPKIKVWLKKGKRKGKLLPEFDVEWRKGNRKEEVVPVIQVVAEKGEEKSESCYRNMMWSGERVTEKKKLCP